MVFQAFLNVFFTTSTMCIFSPLIAARLFITTLYIAYFYTPYTTNTAQRTVFILAERTGFEPAIVLLLYTLSKRAPSTTRPPLHGYLL